METPSNLTSACHERMRTQPRGQLCLCLYHREHEGSLWAESYRPVCPEQHNGRRKASG